MPWDANTTDRITRMVRGVSLANKCQLLFGAAIVLIIFAALCVPWFMTASIIDRGEGETARRIAAMWPNLPAQELLRPETAADLPEESSLAETPVVVRHVSGDRLPLIARGEGFAATSAQLFLTDPDANEQEEALRLGGTRLHRYARAIRSPDGVLRDMVLVEHSSPRAAGKIFINRIYLLTAGIFAGALAVLVFYLITTRLILEPVRRLRDTAERVRVGDLGIRADIHTGDEFEQLAEAFNRMLSDVEAGQEQIRGANKTLALKVNALEESNRALNEAARIKGEFLASVSHELRTPLNSIIGFAELLEEIAAQERPGEPVVVDAAQLAKRRRYLQNIVGAGRSLLEMIDDLLEMAKIEAGKVDLHVEPMNIAEACEGLLALIRPQADRKGVALALELPPTPADTTTRDAPEPAPSLPIIDTDHRKFHQIIFNFLSNAVKFTPEGGCVTLRAERLLGGAPEPQVRVSVLDTGPGIAAEHHERIFEKFAQIEGGHTREHAGTGLGLSICRELTAMIQGEIQLVSEPGRGSMFSLIVPLAMDPDKAAEMTLRTAGRSGAGFGAARAAHPRAAALSPQTTGVQT